MKKALSIIAVLALVSVLAVALVACVPSDPEKAVANLEEAGYITSYIKASDGAGVQLGLEAAFGEGCIGHVSGKYVNISTGGSTAEVVNIVYFSSTDAAKAYYEELKADFEKAEEDKEDYKIGKSGKVVYAGTEAGVKAAG